MHRRKGGCSLIEISKSARVLATALSVEAVAGNPIKLRMLEGLPRYFNSNSNTLGFEGVEKLTNTTAELKGIIEGLQ